MTHPNRERLPRLDSYDDQLCLLAAGMVVALIAVLAALLVTGIA